jgi:putative DNA primase/helicase
MVALTEISPLSAAARSYLEAGLCVLPAKLVAKYPAVLSWKQFQSQLPSAEQVEAWFDARGAEAMCIIAGAVSGNLEMLDFDCQGEVFEAWCELVEAEAPGLIARLVIEQSQSAGKHVGYTFDGPPQGSRKLAEHALTAAGPDPVCYKGKKYIPCKVGDHYEY